MNSEQVLALSSVAGLVAGGIIYLARFLFEKASGRGDEMGRDVKDLQIKVAEIQVMLAERDRSRESSRKRD